MIDSDPNIHSPERKTNYFWRMYALLLSVMLGLLALYIVPEKIGSWWDIKRIDMLSDLRTQPQEELVVDSLIAEQEDAAPLPKPTAKKGAEAKRKRNEEIYQQVAAASSATNVETPTAIIDYSPERTGLKHFFSQLSRRSWLGRPVRIAVLGDSFIEADIFTDGIRLGLQERFGGGGVGLVGLASGVSGYRKSVRSEQRGWEDHSQMDKGKRKHTLLGHLFEPKGSAWASYRMPSGGRSFNEATLYYYSPSQTSLSVEVSGQANGIELESGRGALLAQSIYQGDHIEQLKLSLAQAPSGFIAYGVALEQSEGISLDNMSLRGSSGLHLAGLDSELGQTFAKARPYDLIILQYGLNVASAKQKNYKSYASALRKSILHLKELYPQADVMILGVSDRAQRTSGELRTMEAIEILDAEQRAVAQSLGITYFSLLNAMRSLGGVVEMSSRGETSKDYTHLSHKGGQRLAKVFLEAFILEKDYYDKIHN